MIHPYIKTQKIAKKSSNSGVTLVECLIVLTILAGLIASIGASFIVTLKSYVGEYAAEAIELESQRAALELEFFAARAKDVRILSYDHPSTTAVGYDPTLGGTRVELTQPDDSVIVFQYTPATNGNGSFTTNLEVTGFLAILIPDGTNNITYTYGSEIKFMPLANWRYPFQVSAEGGFSYRWSVPTPASGNVTMGGSVMPGL